ncbi:MBL fold metallo-hydrolase [Apibacter sp.]|uniref:MBL fold metallo-hydrolase n=1 Tax=Apibacter sp. TaxID=2023709 RepID=UPI0025D22608|nr:MBL fold metallo-hydrolase [Apibacter sp.]MCT6868618.1 MBL fold metallo-hydrolase [Apibacter sp.]
MVLQKSNITFLGTGTSQGIPVIGSNDPVCKSMDTKDKRLRTSALIHYKGVDILIDCGPDFRQQMLRENKSNVDVVLITHEHTDHTGGLDDLRPINFLKGQDIPIYGKERVLEDIKRRYAYAFAEEKYPGAPGFELHSVQGIITLPNVSILPINVLHGKLPILGFKIGGLSYITDASYVSEEEIEKIKHTDILVINALRKDAHASHFNLTQALEFIDKVKPQKAYLTHISYQLGFHEEIEKMLPPNVFPAYDGLKVEF